MLRKPDAFFTRQGSRKLKKEDSRYFQLTLHFTLWALLPELQPAQKKECCRDKALVLVISR